MEIISVKRRRVNQGLIVILGLTIVVLSILVFLFVLREVYGKFSSSDFIPNENDLKNVLFGREPNVAILYSDYTKNMLPDNNTSLCDNIVTWEKFLNYHNYKFESISDENIETGNHFKYDLLILPNILSLSDLEIIQIKKFLDKGGSIYATNGTATYSEDGKWRGWDFFSEVFGVKFIKQIGKEDLTKIHTLRGGIPITAAIPTGYPLSVATWDNPIAVEVLDPRTKQISFWYNYRLEAGLVRQRIRNSAGMVYGKYGRGRFIWMGFEINSVIGIREDNVYFEKLFNNSINWLLKQPVAFIKDWPSGYSAAAIIAPKITNDVNNIRNLFPILTEEKIEATFFLEPDLAQHNKELVKYLTKYGEVASLVDIGYIASVNDTVNKLNGYETQLNKLSLAKEVLNNITGKTVSGFLPYYGLIDENTIMAAINSGYNHILLDSLTDRSVPKTIIRGKKRILSITKTTRDDYEVIRNFGLTQPEFQFYTYQEDIDRVLFEGGLFIFKMHSDYQCKLENINVVKDIILELKDKNFWITTAENIQKWYLAKDYLEIKTERRGKSRVAVTISNPGIETATDIAIFVDLNIKAENISVETEVIGTKIATYMHQSGSEFINLYIDDLQPNESRTFYIDFEQVDFSKKLIANILPVK